MSLAQAGFKKRNLEQNFKKDIAIRRYCISATRLFWASLTNDRYWFTRCVGVACESWTTWTDRRMVNDSAVGIGTACSRTRIHALLIYTTSSGRTVGSNNALGSAAWRNSNHTSHTRALSRIMYNLAYAVGTARRRITRIRWYWSQSANFS